jgi:hypothetical protein
MSNSGESAPEFQRISAIEVGIGILMSILKASQKA